MKRFFYALFLTLAIVIQGFRSYAQQSCPDNVQYTLAGNANNHASGYIQLTPDVNSQSGQAWSKKVITLASNFSQKYRAYFGNNDAGGDGFAFVFRGTATAATGRLGGGLGYGTISPSVAVEFDTHQNDVGGFGDYQNAPINDPVNDHTAYHTGGNYTQTGRIGNNIDLGNIEDGAWHDVEIKWIAATKTLETYFNGVLVNTMTRDIVALDLNGNPQVYYGFTASTGGAKNEQAVCIQEIIQTVLVSLSKTVLPVQISDGGTATYTWTFDNSGTDAVAQSGIGFTDALPASIIVANPAGIAFNGWLVNPTVTAAPGGNSVVVSGGTVAAGTTATVAVNITNVPGKTGNCPSPAFTNGAINVTGLSTNLVNTIANPCLTVGLAAQSCPQNAQYTLAGNANNQASGYIQLTPDISGQSGQAWSNSKVTLGSNFSQKFRAYFGSKDAGGDGFAFVFRGTNAPATGRLGGGLGYGTISPSVAVEFDTYQNLGGEFGDYQNAPINDPVNDHTAYHTGGNYTQTGRIGNNVDLGNIENGAWHDVEVKWIVATKTLETYLDGVLVNTMTRDIVALDFAGDPEVYYGFTASTGGVWNEQAVCIQEIIQTIPVSLSKTVLPVQINDGGTAAYTWTFNNVGTGATTQSGVGFTDALPASIIVANPAGITFNGWQVNPTVTAAPGGNNVVVSGGTVAAGTTATIAVNITNVPGQLGSCPSPAFTNGAVNVTGLSNNLTNNIANPCLTVVGCGNVCTNIVTNSTFDTDLNGWTSTGGWSIFNGYAANITDNISGQVLSQSLTGLNAGSIANQVTLTFNVSTGNVNSAPNSNNGSSATLEVMLGGTVFASFTNPGTASPNMVATASNGATVSISPDPYVFGPTLAATSTTVTMVIPWSSMPNTAVLGFRFGAVIGDDFGIDNVVVQQCVNNVPAAPVLSVATQPTCSVAKGSFTITNYNAAYTYTVSPSSGVTQNAGTVTAPAGTYTVIASNGTCASVASNPVTINPAPSAPATPVISGVNPTCTVNTGSISVQSPVSGVSYTLSPGGTVSTTGSFTGLAAGNYTVTATIGSCSSAVSNPVTINAAPVSPATPTLAAATQPTCNVATGSFTITNYNASYTYVVSPSAGVSRSGGTVTAPAGNYTVTATIGSCSSAVSNPVTINAAPSSPATPTVAVATQPTCTVATGSFTITNYNASYTYTVTGPSAVSQSAGTVTASPGTYTVTASNNGCGSAASSPITVTAAPTPPATPVISAVNPTCTVNTGSISVQSPVSGVSYTLSPGGTVSTTGSFTGLVAGSGPYTVMATKSGCSSIASNPISIGAAPVNCCGANAGVITYSGNGQCIAPGTPVAFTVTGNNTASGYTTRYILTDNGGTILGEVASGFPAPGVDATYKIYAVNYNTSSGNTAPVFTKGANISAVGGSCANVSSTPATFCVKGGCSAPGTSISFSASGQNTGAGYATTYVLTDNAGAIISTHTASPITAPATPDMYKIYAINYQTASAPSLSPGTNISTIGGECSTIVSAPIAVCVSTPLPVTLVSFTVTKVNGGTEGNAAELNWTTTEEVNADRFSIERSTNAKDWAEIGVKAAAGDSKALLKYSFTDLSPVLGGASHGMNYYRLKMIDRDETFAYSRIRNVQFDGSGARVILYPNPVSDVLYVKDLEGRQLKAIAIVNAGGTIIYQSASVPTLGINLRNFPAGVYLAKVTHYDGTVGTAKFIIGR